EVGGKPAVVVDVGLAVWHPDRIPELIEDRLASGGDERLQIARQHFIAGGIIVRWFGVRQPVGWVLSVTKPKIIGLNRKVRRARSARLGGLDKRQQTATRVCRLHIRIHWHDELMLWSFGPNAIERFTVLYIGLASDGIT